jgi:hypothetical protein
VTHQCLEVERALRRDLLARLRQHRIQVSSGRGSSEERGGRAGVRTWRRSECAELESRDASGARWWRWSCSTRCATSGGGGGRDAAAAFDIAGGGRRRNGVGARGSVGLNWGRLVRWW